MTLSFVVHYSEVALKGKNRPEFVRALRRNLVVALRGLAPEISLRDGRFFLQTDGSPAEVAQRLSRVFGVAWFAEVTKVSSAYGEIREAVLQIASNSEGSTFKIEPRRSDKTYPINSQELAIRLGSDVVTETGKRVDLSRPDLSVRVDVIKGYALVYSERATGPGGLPVGTAGRVMHLFSGGIDSPVAAWLLMKRGCTPVYVHFYLAPTPDYVLGSKVIKQIKKLSAYGGKVTLVLIPFADYQLATFGVPGELEPSLFRRFMRMTAETLAPSFRAAGVSTGDSLSQAASQTLWNLGAFDSGASLPILRPLLSYDKEEIVSLARRIGTYELSLEDYKDCCAIISRHPRTRARAEAISNYAMELRFTDLVWKSIEGGTLVTYNPTGEVLRASPLTETIRQALAKLGGAPAARGTQFRGTIESKI